MTRLFRVGLFVNRRCRLTPALAISAVVLLPVLSCPILEAQEAPLSVPADCAELLKRGERPLAELTERHFQCAVHHYVGTTEAARKLVAALEEQHLLFNIEALRFDRATQKLSWRIPSKSPSDRASDEAKAAKILQQLLADALELQVWLNEADYNALRANWEFGIDGVGSTAGEGDADQESTDISYRTVVVRRALFGLHLCRRKSSVTCCYRVPVQCPPKAHQSSDVQTETKVASAVACPGSSAQPARLRIWSDAAGARFANAALFQVNEDHAIFRTADGRLASAYLDELSSFDRAYISRWTAQDGGGPLCGEADSLTARRTWRDVTGKYSAEAVLLYMDCQRVCLQRADGPIISVERSVLSLQDRSQIAAIEGYHRKVALSPSDRLQLDNAGRLLVAAFQWYVSIVAN